jgi:hypothetical protein
VLDVYAKVRCNAIHFWLYLDKGIVKNSNKELGDKIKKVKKKPIFFQFFYQILPRVKILVATVYGYGTAKLN